MDVALEWWEVSNIALGSSGAPAGIESFRARAITWFAAARAANRDPSAGSARDFREAAVAAAAHEAVMTLVPAQRDRLDQALATTLSRIPDGPAESDGVAAGRSEARRVLAARTGDGLDNTSVNQPFSPPPPAPGVWQPTPPGFMPATWAGLGNARPFGLERADQFRPGPPPALGSDRYRAEWREVRDHGSANSTVRTAEQTNIATFFYFDNAVVYNPLIVAAVEELAGSLERQVEFLATFNMAIVDALIAVWDAKYHYVTWRPITAIHNADVDGDPLTSPDPAWTPLHTTPSHPDYLSGHAGFAGAAAAALTAYAGIGPDAPVVLTNPSVPGFNRTYTYWYQLAQDMINARVWSGIHTRAASAGGVEAGGKVALYIAVNADRIFG